MIVNLRKLVDEDRAKLITLLARVHEFDAEDQQLVIELLDIYLYNPTQKDYTFQVAVSEQDQMVGFICYGPTPLTAGTFDLYWIAIDPDYAGQGIGTRIVGQMEDELRTQCARLVIIETSSAPIYALTRQFYMKNGYSLGEVIPEFYRWGEDRVTFLKYLNPKPIRDPQLDPKKWADN